MLKHIAYRTTDLALFIISFIDTAVACVVTHKQVLQLRKLNKAKDFTNIDFSPSLS
jgi:hypothetical protein